MAAESFLITIDGFRATVFDALDGLSGHIEVVEFQDGDDVILRKRPGRVTFGNITLRRGQLDSAEFYRWWYAARAGKLERKTMTVAFLDKNRKPVLEWKADVWPVSWEIAAETGARGDLIALEQFTLAVESAELVT